jgi:hypothetical protein
VIASLIGSAQEAQGEVDALREQIDCIVEEAGGCTPVEPEIPMFHVPSGLPRSVIQKMEGDFQGYQVVADATDNRPLPLKRYYEKYCVDTLPGRHFGTTVVGRERSEEAVLRHHVRTSDDVGVDADCACPPGHYCETCSLPLWAFVDSLHLWKPEEIVSLLRQEFNPSVYSVQYEYRALRGGLHIAPGEAPEITWERKGSTLVFQDAAHSGKYTQEVSDWVQAGGLRIGDTTLCCNIVGRVGQCVIYRLCIQDVPLMLTVDADPLSDTFYGDTTPDRVGMGECVDVKLETIIGPITSMYSAGEILYCKVDDREVYLPKQAIGVVALWASGKRRNAKLYSDAFNQAKNWLKNTHLSAVERADCLPYIVAFGLLRNINTESKAIGTMSEMSEACLLHDDATTDPFSPPPAKSMIKFRKWYARNQRWVNPMLAVFGAIATYGVAVFNKGKIVHTLAGFLGLRDKFFPSAKPLSPLAKAIGYASSWFVSRPKSLLLARALDHSLDGGVFEMFSLIADLANLIPALKGVGTIINFFVKGLGKAHLSRAQFPLFEIVAYLCSLISRLFNSPKVEIAGPFYVYCARGRVLKPGRPGSKCKIVNTDIEAGSATAPEDGCRVVEGPFHIGLGVRMHYPVIAGHCIHNDEVAVKNRGICDRKPCKAGWWHEVAKPLMLVIFDVGPVQATNRLEWLARYPERKRKELDDALGTTVEDYYAAVKRKAFTKTECAIKRQVGAWGPEGELFDEKEYTASMSLGDEPIAGYDPRLIQGCYPAYVNATGPFAHAYSKACRGEHGHTTYGPGLTASELDQWLYDAEAHFDEPIAYIDADAVRLDASVPVECIEALNGLYKHVGADEEAMAMFESDVVTHGCTSCGVSYSVPGTVPSGKTTTTCGNTTAVITVVEVALKDIPHKAIVAGDDSGVIVPLRLYLKALKMLGRTGTLAGFEFKLKASPCRYDMEFCSGRWWPADNRFGFAFGPKPGKLLPKLFYSTTKESFGNNGAGYCKAICLGIKETVAHLPVAREFVDRVLEITMDAKPSKSMTDRLERQRMKHNKRFKPVAQSVDIWEAYTHIYNVGEYDCAEAIEEIRAIDALPNLVDHWVYEAFIAADAPPVGDPPKRGGLSLASGLSILHGCLIWLSPYFEERARARSPVVVTLAIIGIEATNWCKRGNSILGYIPAACLHLYCMFMHLAGLPKFALFIHYLFNLYITVLNCRGRAATGNLFESITSASRPESLTSVNIERKMTVVRGLPQRQPQQRVRNRQPRQPAQKQAAVQAAMGYRRPPRRRNRRKANGGGGGRQTRMSNPFSGRETIDDSVAGVVLFGATSYPTNAGLATSFPILSQRAATWEKAHFNMLRYIYTTRTNQFQANGVGTVALSYDYDSADSAPGSLAIALNSRPVQKGAPYKDFVLDVPCNQWTQKDYYNRSGPVSGDIKTYDCGTLHLCVDSTVNTNTIGILEVEYSGVFYDQVQPNSGSTAVNRSVTMYENSAQGFATATPEIVAWDSSVTNGLEAVNTAGSIVLPAGNYVVDWSFQGINATDGNVISMTVDPEKAAVDIYALPFTMETTDHVVMSGSFYFASSGTEALTFPNTLTGTGTLTCSGSLVIRSA